MPSMSPLQGHRALRRGRVSLPNQAYLVTAVCQNREPVFADVGTAEMLTTLISSDTTWPQATVEAWVLMPGHWHGLIVLFGNESLSRVMQRLKGLITRRVHEANRGDGPVWQSGFHDHALRSEESVAGVARYILDNPVRAGLVERWSDWRFRGGVPVESLERTDRFDLQEPACRRPCPADREGHKTRRNEKGEESMVASELAPTTAMYFPTL